MPLVTCMPPGATLTHDIWPIVSLGTMAHATILLHTHPPSVCMLPPLKHPPCKPPSIHACFHRLLSVRQVEEQFRNALHSHAVISLAAAPHTLKALLDKINKSGFLTVQKVTDFANGIQCNDIMSNSKLYDDKMVCETEGCTNNSATPSPTADDTMDAATDIALSQAGPSSTNNTTAPQTSTPTRLISEPIDDAIKYTTKPLGFNFESPKDVACRVCKTKYVGYQVLRRAALAELRKHPDAAELVKACENGNNDTFVIRNEALRLKPEKDGVPFELDMEQLNTPKFQAVLAILVLQFNRHRAGHTRSCFKIKIKGTCRYDLPKSMLLLTTFFINDIQIDEHGNLAFLDEDSDDNDDTPDSDDHVQAFTTVTPTAAIEDDPTAAPQPFENFPKIKAFTIDNITSMDITVRRKIGSEYINRFNPIVMLAFGWNNDMTTMITSPGIIHYVTNYVSKGPDAGATGSAIIRTFHRIIGKRQRDAEAHRVEAETATNTEPGDQPPTTPTYSNQQIAQRAVIATMLGSSCLQEIGHNLVAYSSLFKTTDLHSHKYSHIQIPQMLAYLKKESIHGVMSRVSPSSGIQRQQHDDAQSDQEELDDDDDDETAELTDNEHDENFMPETVPTTPTKIAPVPQVIHTHKYICEKRVLASTPLV